MRAFSPEFRADLADLMRWRRDVVRLAPSARLSEPRRFVRARSARARGAALSDLKTARYCATLQRSGMRDAPEQLTAPKDWRRTRFFCRGFPEHEDKTPELKHAGWETCGCAVPVKERQ